MESKKQKCCNLCAILLTEENLAKRTQRCKPCHKAVESTRHKKYHEDNLEKCHLKNKEYREKHKEYYKEYNKEKYQCHCGSIITNGSSTRHNKCPRHVAWANDVAKHSISV